MSNDSDDHSHETAEPNILEAQRSDETPNPETACPVRSQAAALQVREYEAPRNEVEAGVAEILAGLLKIERVGIHDNFILLGGESLLAAQAAWRIGNRFGCEVSLRSILAGTVANIAAEVLAANSDQQIQ